ncbi:MAG: hypothetical protein WCT27_04445 [Patescibacteria group bacterium]
MDIKSLQDWLRQSRQAGFSDGQIREQLKGSGWTDQQVGELFSGDLFRQGQLDAVGATKKQDFDTMAGLAENQASTGNVLPGVFELIGQAWDLFKSRITKFFVICFIAVILGGAITGVIFMAGGIGVILSLGSLDIDSGMTGLIIPLLGMIGIWLVASLIFSWIQAAILIALTDDSQSIGSILGNAAKIMGSYWWITILVSFLAGGASMIFGIPGIIFSIWFSFAMYVLISENVRGLQAILKSKEYVRGYWWAVLGRNLAIGILVSIPLSLISFGLTYIKAAVISAIFDALALVLVLPFMLCYSYVVYTNLRSIKGSGMVVPQKKGGIIVTAILGWVLIPLILFSISGLVFGSASANAADAARKSDISQLYTAAILYYDDNRAYPQTLNELVPNYINSVRTDPKSKLPYHYTLTENKNNFIVCATLEKADPFSNSKDYCLSPLAK